MKQSTDQSRCKFRANAKKNNTISMCYCYIAAYNQHQYLSAPGKVLILFLLDAVTKLFSLTTATLATANSSQTPTFCYRAILKSMKQNRRKRQFGRCEQFSPELIIKGFPISAIDL